MSMSYQIIDNERYAYDEMTGEYFLVPYGYHGNYYLSPAGYLLPIFTGVLLGNILAGRGYYVTYGGRYHRGQGHRSHPRVSDHRMSRSPSPVGRDFNRRSRSPVDRDFNRSPSPVRRDFNRSPSPVRRDFNRSPSPVRRDFNRRMGGGRSTSPGRFVGGSVRSMGHGRSR